MLLLLYLAPDNNKIRESIPGRSLVKKGHTISLATPNEQMNNWKNIENKLNISLVTLILHFSKNIP
jgi:superfamily II DNA/RNA helicase